MSDEPLFGQDGIDAAHGHTPMPDYTKPKDEEEISLELAAAQLWNERHPVGEEPPPVDRGSDRPEKETVTLSRAAADLHDERAIDAAIAEQQNLANLRDSIDEQRRATLLNDPSLQNTLGVDGQQLLGEQPQQQQQQAQQQQQTQPGQQELDPEVARALQHPQIRQAIESQVQQAEQARVTYANATREAAMLATASVYSQAPELQGVPPEQLPAALQALSQSDPARYVQVRASLENVAALTQRHNQIEAYNRAVETQKAQQQFQQWGAQQDDAYQAEMTRAGVSKEQQSLISETAAEMLAEAGLTPQQIGQLWNSNPVIRSSFGQKLIADAARYRIAQANARNAVAAPKPPMQRPGTATAVRASSELDTLRARFEANPTIANAADLLKAERRQRG